MKEEKLKKLIYDLENILIELKSEIYSDTEIYELEETFSSSDIDYDEIFDDEEYSD